MPTDPKKLESFLNKLASDDEFRSSVEADPQAAYSAHSLTYNGNGSIPAKEHVQDVIDTLNKPADENDDRIFNDRIFNDKIFADRIFHDKIFADKIFADKIFLA